MAHEELISIREAACRACGGLGHVRKARCGTCGGSGVIWFLVDQSRDYADLKRMSDMYGTPMPSPAPKELPKGGR